MSVHREEVEERRRDLQAASEREAELVGRLAQVLNTASING
jgi:hypothetical protein